MDNLQVQLEKIDEFLAEEITSKVQSLKAGKLFIRSQTNLQEPVNSLVIINQTLWSKKRTLFKFKQLISTAVGTFHISIKLS